MSFDFQELQQTHELRKTIGVDSDGFLSIVLSSAMQKINTICIISFSHLHSWDNSLKYHHKTK